MMTVPVTLKESNTHGLGVFAQTFLPAGTVVWRYTVGIDTIIEKSRLDELSVTQVAFIKHFASRSRLEGWYMLCGDHARFMNHSEAPNTTNTTEGIALRDIRAGEEITCNYKEFDAEFGQRGIK